MGSARVGQLHRYALLLPALIEDKDKWEFKNEDRDKQKRGECSYVLIILAAPAMVHARNFD